MKKMKIYLETTVFNRYFEPERDNYRDTVRLFEEIAEGRFEAYTSAYVVKELLDTTDEPKREAMMALLRRHHVIILDESRETEVLAEAYVTHGVITRPHQYDRLHIACTSAHGLDAIISLNFSHINRKKTKELTEPVNRLYGYIKIFIGTPMEVINDGE
ncbi:MAG: hypothetical protein FWE98_04695 [Oscillospiraceae bacterium]|nr:hypothetical protein [Oscillospiraceae bacterium]